MTVDGSGLKILKISTLGLAASLALILSTTSCMQGEANANVDDSKTTAAVSVEVVKAWRGDIQQTYNTITTLEAEREAKIVSRTIGILQKLFVEEGDFVEKDQVLAQLDIEQLNLQVEQMQAILSRLQGDLAREESLFKKQLSTSNNFERAKFEYQSQKAQYELALLNQRYATIRAPFAGIITERSIKPGNLIKVNDELFTLIDPQSLQAVIHLPQKEFSYVAVGQPALLSVDSFPDQIVTGKIARVRPKIDTETGTFQVIASISNSEGLLKQGMFGRIELILAVHPQKILVSDDALITQDNRHHVFVVRDNKAVQTTVSVDIKHNGIVEVTEGLLEGDQVIVTGKTIIKDGSEIEIVET